MNFYIGQRVRLLHHSGEGVITQLLDKHTVEVDLGDDFPIDAHIDEVVSVDKTEVVLVPHALEEKRANQEQVRKMGLGVYDLSLLVSETPNTTLTGVTNAGYRLHLINPEGSDALYSLFTKINHKYSGIARGMVPSGGIQKVTDLSRDQLSHIKEFYFQVVFYKEGTGHPQMPLVQEVRWSAATFAEKKRQIPALDTEAWVLSLRKRTDAAAEDPVVTGGTPVEYLIRKGIDGQLLREEVVVDLHIEALTSNYAHLRPEQMIDIQMKRVHTVLADAVLHNYAKVIFIHGVGEGVLRKEVQKRLRQTPGIKSFAPADQAIYGNGATEVEFGK